MKLFPTLNETDLEGGGVDDVGYPDPDPDSDLTDKITPVTFPCSTISVWRVIGEMKAPDHLVS